MPLTQEKIREIRAWVEGEGCAIGGIQCQDGDLSFQLASALCEGAVNLVYVRTTPLEAELLAQDLAQAVPGQEDRIKLWPGEDAPPEVALTTYSCLQGYLRKLVGEDGPAFSQPTVVVLEHEIGVWVEGLVARDMLALSAARQAEDQEGPWVKILGLSYSSSPQEWLQHPLRLMGGSVGRFSVNILVRPEDHFSAGSLKKAVWDEDGIQACAIQIAHALKEGLNIVVFSTSARFSSLCDAVEDLHAGEFATLKHPFTMWPRVHLTEEVLPVFQEALTAETLGCLICMPHDGFPCALPFERVAMTVTMPPGPKLVYNQELRICVSSPILLTEAQCMLQSRLKGSGQDLAPVTCFINTGSLSKRADHLINLEDDYLAGWLSVINLYPGKLIETLPFFGALLWPAYAHDCLTQLRVMGLVEEGEDGIGFTLTQKGANVMPASHLLSEVSLSGISALASVNSRLEGNAARSAVRLILLLENYRSVVKEIFQGEDAVSVEDFRVMLEDLAVSLRDGGPGRRHVGRGALWAAWVLFEDTFRGIDLSIGELEKCFSRSEIPATRSKRPLVLRAIHACDYAGDVIFWEEKIGLEPLHKGDWAGFELSDADADTIQELLAESYYPFLLDIPIQLKGVGGLRESLGPVLHRTGSLVCGSKDLYGLYMDLWAESVRQRAPSMSSSLYAGLIAPPFTLAEAEKQVRGNAVMVMPYEAVSAVDKDGLDTWASGNFEV